jgi:hypothetical protein
MNEDQGWLIALNCLVFGVLRALPPEIRVAALREFGTEVDVARVVLLNSRSPDALLKAFEDRVAGIEALRFSR